MLEGDGSILVDFIENKRKRVRMVIALSNLKENMFMLKIIEKYIGGKVVIERKDKYVTWVLVSKKGIKNAIRILEKYPLLSTRKQCQWEFAKKFIGGDSKLMISKGEFKNLRDEKYKDQELKLRREEIKQLNNIDYFPG